MNAEIFNTIMLSLAFLALFGFAEVLYYFFNVQAELSRKLVHFSTGILTLLFPIFLNNHWMVLLLCSSFAILLALSLKFNFLKSINAVDRQTSGSLLYPLAVYLTYLFYLYKSQNYFYFYLPISILAICDPLAALFGKKWPLGQYKIGSGTKSMLGSFVFLGSSFLITILLIFLLLPSTSINFNTLLIISLLATVSEAISSKGLDNLSIPLAVFIGIWITGL